MTILDTDITIKVMKPYRPTVAFEKSTTRYIYCECTDVYNNIYSGYVKNDYTLSSKLIKDSMTCPGFISRHVSLIEKEILEIRNKKKRKQNVKI